MGRGLKSAVAVLMVAVYWLLSAESCTSVESPKVSAEMQDFQTFFRVHSDSVSMAPRRLRKKALQRMQTVTDSLVRYNYMVLALKTYLSTYDTDSAQLLMRQIDAFVSRQPFTPALADLKSEYINMRGNLHARSGQMDSALLCFQKAYEYRKKGIRTEVLPDLLMNMADANNRLGKLDVGAALYRKALLLCDSLNLSVSLKTPIYYGLAQIYVALRDFEQTDLYYDLAAKGYNEMLPFEKHVYLNNRGTSYYYRGDYAKALDYFRRVVDLTREYQDMDFELNLSWLNLADCFLQMGKSDSAQKYLNLCKPFFVQIHAVAPLYYIDTQEIKLALLQKDLNKARRLLTQSKPFPGIDPDMLHIRNKNMQQYFVEIGDYQRAYRYMEENNRLDDSVRNERVAMRTADLALRYQQDSTLMAQQVFIREKENEVLQLHQILIFLSAISVIVILIVLFLVLYNKKKQALLSAQNRRTVLTLRLQNIRNRLSPHFIFNVLNRELGVRSADERHNLAALVKLMRRNLELVEQLTVTLTEELDFIKTYLSLEADSLGADFHPSIEVADDVCPDSVILPSMLIQIPVENAVKHALRGKEGSRCLWISVTRKDDCICIRITDNGGGYRAQSRHRGTGTGMKVVMQTIQIFNSQNRNASQMVDVAVHNVQVPTGETGCEVTFLLPDSYNYSF